MQERLSSFAPQTIVAASAPVGSRRICWANAGGGDDRDRTGDPLLAKQVLSQLSYAPKLEPYLAKQAHRTRCHLALNTINLPF
jgi:hypothetical protein